MAVASAARLAAWAWTTLFAGIGLYAGSVWLMPVPALTAAAAINTLLVQRVRQAAPDVLLPLRNALAAFSAAELACWIGLYWPTGGAWLILHDGLHVASLTWLTWSGSAWARRYLGADTRCFRVCAAGGRDCRALRIAGAVAFTAFLLALVPLMAWSGDGVAWELGRPDGITDLSRLVNLAMLPAFAGVISLAAFVSTSFHTTWPGWLHGATTRVAFACLCYAHLQLYTHVLMPAFVIPAEELLEFLPLVLVFHVFAVRDEAACSVASAPMALARSQPHA